MSSFRRQVASTLAHTEGVLHMDIMLKSQGAVEHILLCMSGFLAPGILGEHSHSPECDMYSLAIPMWQLETKEDPFFGQHPQTVIFLILVEAKPPPTPYQKELLSMVGHAADYFQPDYMGVNITGIQSSFSYSRNIKQVLPSIFLLLF